MINKTYTNKEFIDIISRKTEDKNYDYKEKLNWDDPHCKDVRLGIIKDILAMANTMDGGKIIFGVRDKDFKPVGLSDESYDSFDVTKVNDLLNRYTEPKFSVAILKYEINENNVKGKFVLIDVPEFKDTPIICKNNAHSSQNSGKQILKEGGIYIRTDKAGTEIMPSYFEMKELLNRAIRKNGDELLRNIKNLITGQNEIKPDHVSIKGFDKEIEEVNNFFKETLDSEISLHGFWKVSIIPAKYNNIFKDQQEIQSNIKKSEVELRGWNFPHTDHENKSNTNNGFQSYTVWGSYVEGYRAYQSGLFVWKRGFWEDIQKVDGYDMNNVLSFVGAIYSITEFLLFFSRYYRDKDLNSIKIKIELDRIKDRKLVSLSSDVFLHSDLYIAKDDCFVYEKELNITELTINFKEIAKDVIKKLFLIFNCNSINDDVIDSWQAKLIDRKA